MLPGFRHARLNDIDSFAEQIDETVCAVLVETIQGEGGIHTAKPKFLQDLRQLCTEKDILLLIDEVQCGVGRSGKFFAYEYSGIKPDAIGMAKGLAGGFPIGAIWIAEDYANLFTPGSHGTTFGGTPLACSAALAVLDAIEKKNLLEQVTRQSEAWIEEIRMLMHKLPEKIQEVRGMGYLVGVGLTESPIPIVGKLREAGLLTAPAGSNTVRLIPPLTATEEELEESVRILEKVLSE
jgi:acetylornithine aminotransferase/acetylornithine/N-succinyldiaminopimelate aminotransferase